MAEADVKNSAWRLLLIVMLLGAALLGRPHLLHQFWYDEAYTLDHFATGELNTAFCDYHAPNNHILFSAGLSLWRRFLTWLGAPYLCLRFLPYACFIASVAIIAVVCRKLGGTIAGCLAAAIFATSHVTLNFAVELRGYGPSWVPIALGLWAAHGFCQCPHWRLAVAYAAAASCAVGIVPTNLLPCAVIAVWAIASSAAHGWRRALAVAALMVVGPLPGFLVYAHPVVWPQFWQHAATYIPTMTYGRLMSEWFGSTLRDLWYFAPLAVWGLGVMIYRIWQNHPHAEAYRSRLIFILSVTILPPLLLYLPEHLPWERTLVPLLPLWYGGLALSLAAALDAIAEVLPPWRLPLAAALCLLLFLLASWRESDHAGYFQRHTHGDKPFGLYDQYCQQEFRPWDTVWMLHQMAQKEYIAVFTDNSDLWSLVWIVNAKFAGDIGCYFVYYRLEKLHPEVFQSLCAGRQIIIVACNTERGQEVLRYLQTLSAEPLPGQLREISSTGFFKIYRCEAQAGLPDA